METMENKKHKSREIVETRYFLKLMRSNFLSFYIGTSENPSLTSLENS